MLRGGFELTLVWVRPNAELNVVGLGGNTERARQVPMFGGGRLGHLALEVASIDAFDEIRELLLARHAAGTPRELTPFGHGRLRRRLAPTAGKTHGPRAHRTQTWTDPYGDHQGAGT